MGFDPECLLNINLVPRELFCPICRQLVYPSESQQTSCGHIYCQPCISYVVSSTRQCPLDGTLLSHSDFKPLQETSPLLHSTLGQVAVRCLYYRSGCSWQGELVTSLAHTASCSYGSFPVQCNRCGQQILHRQVQDHARTCVGIASQVYAPEQTASQQHSLPNLSTSQTEQHMPQQVAEVNPPYLQQGFSGSLTEQQQQQHQQQVLDSRQVQTVVGQEQQQVLAAGQQQGGPQLYPTDWYYQQYYQQPPQQNEQQLGQIVPQQQDSILAQEQYPVQQAQHDNTKLQQQLLQEQQKPQHLWMQQPQQSGWEQSSGSSGLQQGQIAAPEGNIYQQFAVQQYAAVQQLPLEKHEQQHQQYASQGNGLSAQPLQQLHQHMIQTPSEALHPQLNRETYLQQQPQTYPQQDNPGIQPQQQQYQKFPYQSDHHQPYINPEQHQFSESHPENLSIQNDLQQRQLLRNMYGSLEYPCDMHPNQKTPFHQQQGVYEHFVHPQQNQAAPFDNYQQYPVPPSHHQQFQHDQKQAMLPMTEIREAGTNGQPIYINGSDPHFYVSPLHPQQFHNSQPFPLPEDPLREGDRKQLSSFSLPQHASPGRSPHDSMGSINRQRMMITNQLNEPKNPQEMASDAGVPLATYIRQQQDQLHKQRDLPQKGAPFILEHDSGLQPPFLEQATDKQLNWNRQQRPDMLSPPSQGVSSMPLDTEILSATQQGYNQKMVPGPPEQFYRPPHPQIRPSALISSYGKQPDGFKQFLGKPESSENPSLGFISTPGPSWNQAERPLSGYKAKEHLEFAEQPDASKFNKPFVDGPPEKRYSEQLKHAQSLVARFGADNSNKRHLGEDIHPGHDNTLRRSQPNFSSESLDFMSDRILANPQRNFLKPNEHSLWSNPGLHVQEEPISNSADPFKRHMGPTRDFSRPISNTGSPPPFEDYAGSIRFPSEVRAFPDPLVRSQFMPMQDTVRSKFDLYNPKTEPRFMDLEHPMPWTRGGRVLPNLPPQLLGPRNIHASPLVHRTGDAALLPFGPEHVRNPFLDSQLNSSRPSMINRERPSLPAGRPLFFDAPDSRLRPPSRRFMGLQRHEFANGGPQLEPFNTVANDDPHDHGRKRKVVDSPVWCRICEVDCFSVQGLEKHSQSAEHQKMAMQLVLSIKEDDAKRTRKEEDDEKSSSDGGESPE